MSRESIFNWAEAYFQCKVKKGEQLSFDQVICILNDKWRGCIPRHGFHAVVRTRMPYLISNDKRGEKRVYTNTLGDHYGEDFPTSKIVDGVLTFKFKESD